MPIQKMDHFTILTKDWKATAKFYEDILGFKAGERPNFAFPGCWLHNDGKPILHVIERPEIPKETGLLDHMAFSATGLADYIGKLKARDIKYDLRRVPEGGYAAGVWQVFFLDPNGAKVELDFARGRDRAGRRLSVASGVWVLRNWSTRSDCTSRWSGPFQGSSTSLLPRRRASSAPITAGCGVSLPGQHQARHAQLAHEMARAG